MDRFTRIGCIFILTFVFLFPLQVSSSTEAPDTMSVTGKVLSFANPAQSKSISVDIAKKGVMVFKYENNTEFSNFKSITELTGSTVKIKYRTDGTTNNVLSITKAYVKLPEGVREIKTKEVESIIKMGPTVGKYTLIDARPGSKYGEGHIPSAMSIPVAKLKEKGKEILPRDKDHHIIFYCGGPT